ncbi:Porin B precursor [compost metagenome]
MHQHCRRGKMIALAMLLVCADATLADDGPGHWMTGDWNGARTRLVDAGIDLQVSYNSQLAGNLQGGFNDDRTVRYVDQWAFRADLDFEKLFDWPAADARITISKRNGHDLSIDRLADPRAPLLSSSVQSSYGYGDVWRLSHLWYRQRFDEGRVEIKLGRLPMGDDLGTAGCDFQNLAFCGALPAHGTGIWINYPVSQWGIQGKWQFTPVLNVQIGAFEYNPSLTGPNEGFTLDTEGRVGSMYIVEFGWTPRLGARGLAGNYRVGTYFNSTDADDLLMDVEGNQQPLTGLPFKRHSHRRGAGLIIRQQLAQPDPGQPLRGPEIFFHYTRNDRNTARVDEQWQAALLYQGLFNARPDDRAGIGLSNVHGNRRVVLLRSLENALNGIDPDDPAYQLLPRTEVAAELFYQWQLRPWLSLRPNLQYIGNPGGVASIDDAWVIGLTVNADL